MSHRNSATEGTILFDGKHLRVDEVRSLVGYVPQEDVMMASLTVRETLHFYAKLTLSRKEFTKEMREKRVEQLITELHLQKCADTYVGNELIKGISGGEKRRTSIAVALLNEPGILFLDEVILLTHNSLTCCSQLLVWTVPHLYLS